MFKLWQRRQLSAIKEIQKNLFSKIHYFLHASAMDVQSFSEHLRSIRRGFDQRLRGLVLSGYATIDREYQVQSRRLIEERRYQFGLI